MLELPDELLSDQKASDVETILQFYDDAATATAFDYYWKKLEGSPSSTSNLHTLRACIRLLPPSSPIERTMLLYGRVSDLILSRIPIESNDVDRLYTLADMSVSNAQVGSKIFSQLVDYLVKITGDELFWNDSEELVYRGESSSREEHVHRALAYLNFLRVSYWLPPAQNHYITPEILELLVSCVGKDVVDEAVHDTLSALLNLLARPPIVALCMDKATDPWLRIDPELKKPVAKTDMIGHSFFVRLLELPPEYFSINAGKAFRTWFQWVVYACANGLELESVYDPLYWSRLRIGLLEGFADQRKYCLGILRQSLLLAQRNIDTPQMVVSIERRSTYETQYERFSTLFETIILDRYPNQVQACLPELTALLGPTSVIAPNWTTALLSAALKHKIQDGIRKLVGNWYLAYVTEEKGPIAAHANFLVEGYLPWATQGSLFTSTLVSDRTITSCSHGAALSNVITKFIVAMPTDLDRRRLLAKVLSFILNTGGKIFASSVLYLLEGLLNGFNAQPTTLEAAELELIFRISRIPSLPEIATDLCCTYCVQLSKFADPLLLHPEGLPGYGVLMSRFEALGNYPPAGSDNSMNQHSISQLKTDDSPLQGFLEQLRTSRHKSIQNDAFALACARFIAILDKNSATSFPPHELLEVLEAYWEEADRQEYPRPVIINLPPLSFHATCMRICVREHSSGGSDEDSPLTNFLSKAVTQLQRLTEGRSYILPVLAIALRKACFLVPQIMSILPLEHFFVRFINNPPYPKREFLFEAVAAGKLQKYLPHRDYASYYGQREWYGYAAIIDLFNRIPEEQLALAKRVFDRLIEPWRAQKPPIPIISKWKDVLQLQVILLLTESCINESDAEQYLDVFIHALVLEPWPRYRFLLEWIIARIYCRFPSKTQRILKDVASLDENSPVHVASLIKLATLVAPFLDSEDFALKLMIQLVPLSASPKVHIRHEAHFLFPTIFGLAEDRKWSTITDNPAFQALNNHVRGLDKFSAAPSTIRTLTLDAVKDYTIVDIFQGRYLTIETPEIERVVYDEFVSLYAEDSRHSSTQIPQAHTPLGDTESNRTTPESSLPSEGQAVISGEAAEPNPAFFQTKSGFDVISLLPAPGPPSAQTKRPASVILIASLIDNPTNLGGLSRISESFGLEALYIDDLKKTGHKDFKATSVTSEKHFPIRELRMPAIPEFLVSLKRRGYEVVGVEQTDRSGILGEEKGVKGIGTLPKKCVLVLGSEKGGITAEVLAVVDRCVEIKTVGVTRSLNVQTAGGIAVYEWWREWGGQI